jgi:hypothetical protein
MFIQGGIPIYKEHAKADQLKAFNLKKGEIMQGLVEEMLLTFRKDLYND